MATKKKKNPYVVKSLAIKRQSGSNALWASWTVKAGKKKITKNVYDTKKKKKVSKSNNWTKVIAGYSVKWYYAQGKNSKGKYVYYLDNAFTTTSKNTSANLYAPPDTAAAVKVVVKPISKEYRSSASKTAKWFTSAAATKILSNYDEYPEPPGISDFKIDNDGKMTASLTFSTVTHDAKRIGVQVLKDESTIAYAEEIFDLSTTQQSVGIFKYSKQLSASDVGSFQIRARIYSQATGGIKSDWSAWSSALDTRPPVPQNLTYEAIDTDKVRLRWDAVKNITRYDIEYVTEKEEYFDSGAVSSVSVEDVTTHILTGLSPGTTYYIRIRSVSNTNKSDPSAAIPVVVATKPSMPSSWSSTTNAVVTTDPDTTEELFLYYTHNSTDGSAQRMGVTALTIGDQTYYYPKENTERDDYGNLIDKITQLSLWKLTGLYSDEACSVPVTGTIHSIFMNSASSVIKWKVKTKGIHADYSDWSVERAIYAYIKPNIYLTVTDGEGNELPENKLINFPMVIRGETTPTSQTPISYDITIESNNDYETVDNFGENQIINSGTSIFNRFIDSNEQLNLTLNANDVDFDPTVSYILKVVVHMDSGLNAEAEYSFSVDWSEVGHIPDAEIEYETNFRYCDIRPVCLEYLGFDNEDDLEPTIYRGATITKLDSGESLHIYPSSGISASNAGDMYINTSTRDVFTCEEGGNASQSKWRWKHNFSFADAASYRFGSSIGQETEDGVDELSTYSDSGITTANINDYYFNTTTGDILKCITSGTPDTAIWEVVGTIYQTIVMNLYLNVYRQEVGGAFVTLAENIVNDYQDTDSAVIIRDYHPNFGECNYRIVAVDRLTGAIAFSDIVEDIDEDSIVIQWNETIEPDDEADVQDDGFTGSVLEIPYNVTLSDKNSKDVAHAGYIGRSRAVSYYGTQLGESPTFNGVFLKSDSEKLSLLRRLMNYMGDVYFRDPSGLGYWATVDLSYNRQVTDKTIPVSINVTPVDGDPMVRIINNTEEGV